MACLLLLYAYAQGARPSGGNNADALFWRGAAAVRLSDLLSDAGYNVEILMFIGGGRRGGKYSRIACTVTAKAAHMPLDKALLSGCVCHPAFFRSLGHRWGSIANKDKGDCYYGGYDPQEGEVPAGAIIANDSIRTLDDAREFVRSNIAALQEAIAA